MQSAIRSEDDAFERPLPTPRALRAALPRDGRIASLVERARRDVRNALHGRDPRLVVVVGPCSLHDADQALDYAARLARLRLATRDQLIVIMRTYFEKPRTTVGWKGLINDPWLDGSCDIATGLERARELLLEINRLGVPCGTELLDPLTPAYLGDLLAWGAIGARTSESQVHRELASAMPLPVGFKNGTDGALEVARDALLAAARPHRFIGIDADGRVARVDAAGNPDGHLVLRGGAGGPNYAPRHVARAASLVEASGLARPVMVDCSHDNSGQDARRQGAVCRAVLGELSTPVLGVLLESQLREGRQTWQPGGALEHGVSITDACIGWEETEALLLEAAAASKRRAEAGTLPA